MKHDTDATLSPASSGMRTLSATPVVAIMAWSTMPSRGIERRKNTFGPASSTMLYAFRS
jgi:hypothetical protein